MWEQIRSNQVRSVMLIAVIAALLLAVGYFLGLYFFDSATGGLVIALAVWAIMSLIAYFQGDSILLSISGAKKIGPNDAPRLYNVVEEMKIASGLEKMPDVYIIDDPALNAFATGRDPTRASVAITSGLLQKLNRDELQGVIGHEISHIKNRDVLLMAICSVMLGTIVMLSWYASRFLMLGALSSGSGRRSSSRSSGGGGAQVIILVVGLILMILAPIMAQLIYYAISRKREYLADASSALYTRYPEGLASALEKLGASTQQLKTANQATAPMYIINPLHKEGMKISDLTSTHPPISERIRILRAMAGNASFDEYDKAYRQVHSAGKGVISKSTMSVAGTVGIRPASLSAPGELEPTLGKAAQTREVSDMMLRLNKYKTVDCECGARWKIPPGFRDDTVLCTRCGRRIKV